MTSDGPAVEVVIDRAVWYVGPDPYRREWTARPAAAVGAGDVPPDPLWLRRTGSEGLVPTSSWGLFLAAEPLPTLERPRRHLVAASR
jgi:hypothetical protein